VRTEAVGVQGSGFEEEEKNEKESQIAANPTGRGERRNASFYNLRLLWHWNFVWLLLGLAAAFHVLVGGWAVVAALLTWLTTRQRPTLVSMLPALWAGGLISLLGVIPALGLAAGAAPEVVREAHRIYVFERLNHHLVIHDFPWSYRLQFLGVLVAWLIVCWLTRASTPARPLRKSILAALAIAGVGIAIDQATLLYPDIAASLLRFYWFRLADMLVPIGLALGLAELWNSFHRRVGASLLLVALCLVPMVVIGWRAAARMFDQRSGAEIQAQIAVDDVADWREACAWVKRQTPVSSRFLTPPAYQCFRWHAERSEIASWKDIPQSAAGIVEWRQRNRATRAWWQQFQQHGDTPQVERRLRALAAKYDVQYVIVPHALTAQPLGLTPLFSNATGTGGSARGYTVYWIGPSQ
jgi:hypothetical protein